MDKISLTDLRRQFFGPTLDESLLYGVDCLMDLFGAKHDELPEQYSRKAIADRMSLKRSVSDLDLFKSCRDVSLHNEENSPAKLAGVVNEAGRAIGNDIKQEKDSSSSSASTGEKFSMESSKEERIFGKIRSINSSTAKGSSESPRNSRLSSSSTPSSKSKSSSSRNRKILEQLKKELANSYILETQTNPALTPRDRHTPRASHPTSLRSLSTPPLKTSSRRPKLIRTRWALVRVNEFDDAAKTYEILQTSADDVHQLKKQLIGAEEVLPPEMVTDIVFASLPDGSTVCYRAGSKTHTDGKTQMKLSTCERHSSIK